MSVQVKVQITKSHLDYFDAERKPRNTSLHLDNKDIILKKLSKS